MLPYNIDGLRKFSISCDAKDMMKVTKDGGPWKTWCTSSRMGFSGLRRVARCKGSMECSSQSCSYMMEHGFSNRFHFQTISGISQCFTCSSPAELVECPATKAWEYDFTLKMVTVFHDGLHTCAVKKLLKRATRQEILKVIRRHPTVKPSKLLNNEMVNAMSAQTFDWKDVVMIAEQFADAKQIQNVRDGLRKELHPVGENFEAVGEFRNKCAEKDEFLIYSVNSRDLNGQPSYVFKSSIGMATLASQMDRDGDGILSKEYAHIDATHTRCRKFKSLTLWTYHPVMRKLLRLAIMEVEKEDTDNITKFWELLNEILIKVSGKKFNPVGFVADEHHANWISLNNVFGKDVIERVVSCEFHYKQSVQRHGKRVGSSKEIFISIAERMLTALSMTQFEATSAEMKSFTNKHTILTDWFQWWYERRTHIFKAFKPAGAPASNLAEVGHAKLAAVGRRYMSLLETAREDVAGAIRQDAEIKLFNEGLLKGGRGKNSNERKLSTYQEELKRARAYGTEVVGQNKGNSQPHIFVPKKGRHRPPEKRRKLAAPVILKPKGKRQRQDTLGNDTLQGTRNDDAISLVGNKDRAIHANCEPFHVTLFGTIKNIKTCYGCKTIFKDANKKAPNDLILKHFCRRQYLNKEGVRVLTSNTQAAYFHFNLDCARKIQPRMERSDILLHTEVRECLTEKHEQFLTKFGIQ